MQREGGPVEEIRPGDVVWFPPGLKHWHGASPTTAMTHIAIQEAQNGSPVTWMEKVSDDQYLNGGEDGMDVKEASAMTEASGLTDDQDGIEQTSGARRRPLQSPSCSEFGSPSALS